MRVVQKWELTSAALDRLLAGLDADPTAAGQKYEHLRRALLKFFTWRGTPEPETSVDETLDRLARRLDAGHTIDDIPAFAYGVAKLVFLERRRQSTAMPVTSDEGLVARAAAAPPEREEVRDTCLNGCLGELPRDDRDLIVTYYVGAGRDRIQSRARLAATLGLSENALRHRAQRLRDRLRICASSCIEQAE
jgi:DNA-directed RNA polymerase specialized sigma24 family protein